MIESPYLVWDMSRCECCTGRFDPDCVPPDGGDSCPRFAQDPEWKPEQDVD